MTDTLETPVVLEEKRYEYQPTDDNGVPMGGPQVIKYTTTEDLIQKLQENNVRLQRKLREANRKNRTGQLDPEEIPDTAPRYAETVDFAPKPLSADELIEVTQNITDPTKAQAAFNRLAKATFGADPAQILEALKTSQQAAIDNKIRVEVDKFLVNNPDYYICTENWNTIYNWMDRFNLAPIEDNFTMAFKRLSAADILLTSGGTIPGLGVAPSTYVAPVSIPAEVVPANLPSYDNTGEFGGEITVQPVEIINFDPSVSTPPTAPVQRVSTSLTNNNTQSGQLPAQVAGADIVYVSPVVTDSKGRVTNPSRTFYGLKALDAMPPDDYEKRFRSEPGFKEKVDKLLATRKIHPNQR
jgi:hypothetical protein